MNRKEMQYGIDLSAYRFGETLIKLPAYFMEKGTPNLYHAI